MKAKGTANFSSFQAWCIFRYECFQWKHQKLTVKLEDIESECKDAIVTSVINSIDQFV